VNNEVIAELKNIIGHQAAKVDQLSKLVENLSPAANSGDLQPLDKSWVDLNTIAAQLKILPKSVSGAASKKGRDIGDDTIEFEVAGQTIYRGYLHKPSKRGNKHIYSPELAIFRGRYFSPRLARN
jgi:hypothetical protein